MKNQSYEIYKYWTGLSLGCAPLTKICAKRIKDKIKELGYELVKESIKNYNLMIHDSNCNCPRWELINFMTYHVQEFVYIKNAYNLWCKNNYEYDEDGYLI